MTHLFSLLNYSLAQSMGLNKVWLEHFKDASMFTRIWLLVSFLGNKLYLEEKVVFSF